MKEHFSTINNVINLNAQAIKDLITQSQNLDNIINRLNNKNSIKQTLEDIKDNISNSIRTLVEQTENLFVAYDKLIDASLNN